MSGAFAGLPRVGELLESAFGEGYAAVVVALVVGYLLAACVVFRYPSPFRARVGGSLGKQTATTARDEKAYASDDDGYPAPMPEGDMTVGELKMYDGSDPSLPVLVAAKGRVYDVTRGRDFYGREWLSWEMGRGVLLVLVLLVL